METKQTVESEQQKKVIPDEEINASNSIARGGASASKRKILKRIWTFCLQHPAVVAGIGVVLGGIGTFLLGIAAIRPDSSNLSLNGEDIIKFIQAVKSEEREQFDESLRKVSSGS